jgi:serine/threonine-protein kinase
VRTRILIGAGAWLLGTAAATVGSTLAVSRMGQGIADAPSQQLTAAMVQRALASESAEAPTTAPSRSPTKAPAVKLGVTATPITRNVPSSSPSPTPTAATSPQSSGSSVLTSEGGTVVAGCGGSGAYLQSWSPQQGYEARSVVRGPAATAQVVFKSSQRTVTMTVSCTAGVPSAATQVQNTWGGDD